MCKEPAPQASIQCVVWVFDWIKHFTNLTSNIKHWELVNLYIQKWVLLFFWTFKVYFDLNVNKFCLNLFEPKTYMEYKIRFTSRFMLNMKKNIHYLVENLTPMIGTATCSRERTLRYPRSLQTSNNVLESKLSYKCLILKFSQVWWTA